MIRDVLRMGDPRLWQKSLPVEKFGTPELLDLLEDMRDTMAHLNGAGLAAPQIGVPLRVVIFGVTANPRYPGIDDGARIPCSSIPCSHRSPMRWKRAGKAACRCPECAAGCRAFTSCATQASIEQGNFFRRDVEGFHARVVQHEVDHLDGVLYPMRIRDLTRFGFNEELFPDANLPPED